MSRVFLYFFDLSLDIGEILWYNITRVKNAPVAQLVEHLTFNQVVRSSTLRRSTKNTAESMLSAVFFIHCESNGISSRLGVYIIRFDEHISSKRVYHQPTAVWLSQ